MALHKLPPIALSATTWLALGPIATGSLGMFLLSEQSVLLSSSPLLGQYHSALVGFGWGLGVLLWGFGAWWLLLALVITYHYAKQGIPFNLGWWGYTFPLGVFTLATFKIAHLTSMALFSSLATSLLLLLAGVWLLVMMKTVQGVWRRRFFIAARAQFEQPCGENR